jgi:predicted dehydrogenase
MITGGDLGTILHIEGNMSSHVGFDEIYTSDMWRVAPGESPAGGLGAAGIHVIDTMIHLLGPVTSVVAQSDRLVHQIDHDDITSMLLQFDSKATGYVTTMTATAPIFRMQVFGDKGWLELRDANDLLWKSVEGKRQDWTFPNVSTERKQLETFAKAIQTRTAYPISTEDIINGIAVFEGVIASLSLDKRITL